jgi:hypothetical protein
MDRLFTCQRKLSNLTRSAQYDPILEENHRASSLGLECITEVSLWYWISAFPIFVRCIRTNYPAHEETLIECAQPLPLFTENSKCSFFIITNSHSYTKKHLYHVNNFFHSGIDK